MVGIACAMKFVSRCNFPGLPSVIATRPHFHEPCLIEGAAVNVYGVSIICRPHGQSLVMLDGLLHVLGIVFVDVVVGSEQEPGGVTY